MKYLPSLDQVSKQVIASFVATIVIAIVVSKIPALKDLTSKNP